LAYDTVIPHDVFEPYGVGNKAVLISAKNKENIRVITKTFRINIIIV